MSKIRPQIRKMERFTQHARRVLSLAQEEAERLQHSDISPVHLFLGLLREEGSIGGRVLGEMGFQIDAVREIIAQKVHTDSEKVGEQPTLSEGTKRCLELAVDEARRMGHRYIGTEHLLLGILGQANPTVRNLLTRFNSSPEEIRRHVLRVLQEAVAKPKQQEINLNVSNAAVELNPAMSNQARSSLLESRLLPSKQRFAGEWRITMGIARAAAIQFKSKLLEPEHLLIALVLDEGDRTGKLLRAAGVDLDRALEIIQLSRVPSSEPVIEAEMSPKMVELLGLATAESWKDHNYYLQVEHLLLGLLRQKENVAIDILNQQKVNLVELEKATRESLK